MVIIMRQIFIACVLVLSAMLGWYLAGPPRGSSSTCRRLGMTVHDSVVGGPLEGNYIIPPARPMPSGWRLVVAGQHGNEPAPSDVLSRSQLAPDVCAVPRAAPAALAAGTRTGGGVGDLNRGWPAKSSLHRRIRPWVDGAALVVDLHEAWGGHSCDGRSLGQTIWTNDPELYPMIDQLIKDLNAEFASTGGCMTWSRKLELPKQSGTLDDYCTGRGIPCILVECAGQADVVPLATRHAEIEMILAALGLTQ